MLRYLLCRAARHAALSVLCGAVLCCSVLSCTTLSSRERRLPVVARRPSVPQLVCLVAGTAAAWPCRLRSTAVRSSTAMRSSTAGSLLATVEVQPVGGGVCSGRLVGGDAVGSDCHPASHVIRGSCQSGSCRVQ
jgi:hypothetical protein